MFMLGAIVSLLTTGSHRPSLPLAPNVFLKLCYIWAILTLNDQANIVVSKTNLCPTRL